MLALLQKLTKEDRVDPVKEIASKLESDFTKHVSDSMFKFSVMVRSRLSDVAKAVFGPRLLCFPKIKYLNSHSDIVDCDGINIPKSLNNVLPKKDWLSNLSGEIEYTDLALIYRADGLWVYKKRGDLPLRGEGEIASAMQYVLFGPAVVREILKFTEIQ